MNNKNGEGNSMNEQRPDSTANEPFGGLAPGIASGSATDDERRDARAARRRIFAVILICIIIILLGLRAFSSNMPQSKVKNSGVANQTKTDPNRAVTIELPLSDLNQQGVVAGNSGQFVLKNGLIFLPTIEPTNPKPGEVYYNLTTNILNYFNGTRWVEIDEDSQVGNSSSNIITIIQGSKTADYLAGTGIAINDDREISNTGILNVTGTPNQVLVSVESGTASLSLPQDIATTSSPTFYSLQLTTPLSVLYGGTGVSNIPANGVVIGNGTNGVTTTTASGAGQCLISTSGAPVFGSCPGGGSPDSLQNAYDNSTSPATITTSSAAKNVVIKSGAGNDSTGLFQVQNASGGNVLNVDTVNSQLSVTASGSVTYGSNLITDSNFSTGWTGTGWTLTPTDATHITGNTNALSPNTPLSVQAGKMYKASFNMEGGTTGYVVPRIGGKDGARVFSSGGTAPGAVYEVVIIAETTGSFSFTPSSTLDETISNVSVVELIPQTATLAVRNSDSTAGVEIRSGGSGLNNTHVGLSAGAADLSVGKNTSLGSGALQNVSSASSGMNVAVGMNAMQNAGASGLNTAIGYSALQNGTGTNNVGIGWEAMKNYTGSQSTGIGVMALQNGGGNSTTAIGYGVLKVNQGFANTGIGTDALRSNTTGADNVGVGYNSLQQTTTGHDNTAVGNHSLAANTTGYANSAFGYASLNYATTGIANVAMGYYSLFDTASGSYNTAIGVDSLTNNNGGSNNTAVGYFALGHGGCEGCPGNSNNTALGYEAGYNVQGGGNVFLGYQAGRNETGANKLYIDNSSTSSPLIAGDFSTNALTVNGALAVTGALTVSGSQSISGSLTAGSLIVTTATSNGRLTVNNGHFRSTQDTAPTIGAPTNCGTSPTASLTAVSTDSAGSFTINAGTGAPTTCNITVSFNIAYGSGTPRSIVLTPRSANASAKGAFVSAGGTSSFTVQLSTAPGASESNSFYYWIVE